MPTCLLLTPSGTLSPALPRCHQCRRDVSLTSLGVPSHLCTGEAMNQRLMGPCSAPDSAMLMQSLLTTSGGCYPALLRSCRSRLNVSVAILATYSLTRRVYPLLLIQSGISG